MPRGFESLSLRRSAPRADQLEESHSGLVRPPAKRLPGETWVQGSNPCSSASSLGSHGPAHVEDVVNTFDLSSISEHDQLATELIRRGHVIAQFYRAMVDDGLPVDLAGSIVVEWARASIQTSLDPGCGCDCDICRGEA